MLKVLIADAVHPDCAEILKATCEVEVRPGLSEDDLVDAIGDTEVVVVRSAVRITERVIEAGKQLRVIGRAGAGVDTIDLDAATRNGVVVMNTPGGNAVSTAEHTIALLFSCARSIPAADRSLRAGRWDRKKFLGTQLRGKSLGVVGLGKVGSEVARLARGLGMVVHGHDPFLSPDAAERMGITLQSVDALFENADFVTLHTPLVPATEGLVNRERLARMKPGARLVNCARGGLVDEEALREALDTGRLAGAAIDVFQEEPPKDNPLLEIENLVATPHLGASTAEAQREVAVQIARQINAYAVDGTVQNAVNMPSVAGEEALHLQPYLDLVERLGALAGQLMDGPVQEVTVELHGDVLERDTRLLSAATARGLLKQALAHPVNLVSAPLLAKERGITLREVRSSEHDDFATLVGITARGENESHAVAGTLFGRKEPRVVRIDEFEFDAVPEGDMVLLTNRDEPGVVGCLGTILGNHEINIAAMSLSRGAGSGTARVLLNLDAPMPDIAQNEILGDGRFLASRQIKI